MAKVRAGECKLRAVVAAPGGSVDVLFPFSGLLSYFEVAWPDEGSPEFYLQIVNARGTVVWESPVRLTVSKDTPSVCYVGDRIDGFNCSLRIKESTLAGEFTAYANYRG